MENEQENFQIIYPHAAGIDCGSREHVVAIGRQKEYETRHYHNALKTAFQGRCQRREQKQKPVRRIFPRNTKTAKGITVR